VLKSGGVTFFVEFLGNNPLISLYRWMTQQYRTVDEAPIDQKAMAPLLSRFRAADHTDYYVTALAAVALACLPFGRKFYPSVKRLLVRIDDGLLRLFPSLGRLAWYTILRIKKSVSPFIRETRRDIPISLGSEKSATSMPSAARDVLRTLRLALRAAPQLPQ
jgi:hypothetical protein